MGKLGNSSSEVDFDGKAAAEFETANVETDSTGALDSEGKFTEREGGATPGSDCDGSPTGGRDTSGRETSGTDAEGSAADGTGIAGLETPGSELAETEALGTDTGGRDTRGREASGMDAAGSEADGRGAEGSPKLADTSEGSNGPRMEAPGEDTEAPTDTSGIPTDTAGPVTAGREASGNETEGKSKPIETPGKDAEASLVAPGTSTAGGVAGGSTADDTGSEGSPRDSDALTESSARPAEELGTEVRELAPESPRTDLDRRQRLRRWRSQPPRSTVQDIVRAGHSQPTWQSLHRRELSRSWCKS
jgi:hypothetical protein